MEPDSGLSSLLAVFRRHRRMVISAAFLAAVPVAVAAWLVPPRYTAKAEILVEADGPFSATQDPEAKQRLTAATILTEVTELSSSGLLRRVVAKLRADSGAHKPAPAAEKMSVSTTNPGALARTAHENLLWDDLQRIAAFPGEVRQAVAKSHTAISLRSFERNLRVFQQGGSHVVAVTFTSTDPNQAALAANTLVQMHLNREEQEARQATRQALLWLDRQIPLTKKQVESVQADARAYRHAKHLPSIGDLDLIKREIIELNAQAVIAEGDLAASEEHAKQTSGPLGNTLSALPASQAIPGLEKFLAQEALLLQERTKARFTYPPTSPIVQRLEKQLATVRRQITDLQASAKKRAKGDATAESAKVEFIRRRLRDLQDEANEPKLEQMARQVTFQNALLENLMKRREALLEQNAGYTAGVRVLSLAVPPDRPSSINPILFLPPALILGCVGAVMLGLLRDAVDTTLHNEREVQARIGIHCVGMVPKVTRDRHQCPHRLLIDQPYSTYAEAVRFVATGLRLLRAPGSGQVILVTSAVPGEGKTTLAVTLAALAATMGRRVLLMDLDFRHPSVMREISTYEPQRAQTAHNGITGEPAVHSVPGLELDLMDPRRDGADVLKVFATEHMSSLVNQFRYRYDCVIIDSAPLLAMAEARLIASLADQVVIAIKWASTRADIVQNAVAMLQAASEDPGGRTQNVSAVITQTDLKKHARQCAGDLAEIAVKYRSYYAPVPVRK